MLLGPSEHAGSILAKEQARRDEGVGGPGRRVEVRALPWIAALDAGPVVMRALPLGLGPREGDVGAEEVGQLTRVRSAAATQMPGRVGRERGEQLDGSHAPDLVARVVDLRDEGGERRADLRRLPRDDARRPPGAVIDAVGLVDHGRWLHVGDPRELQPGDGDQRPRRQRRVDARRRLAGLDDPLHEAYEEGAKRHDR